MTAPVRAGEILARKYRIERVLGEGGMGVVVGARHIHLDELVAIKLLRADVGKDEKVVERFMREARMAAKIKSEHVVRVSDVDTLDSGEPFIVMEYLRGRDLQSVFTAGGALDIEEAVDYVLQACDAIAEAHGRGIVHRDLKPANLFLARRPNGSLCVKVLDFGISKLSERARAAQLDMTSTSTVLGSPNYMSPEQMRSAREVDGRTDIWSLGITLYQLLTGALPFAGETVAAVHGLVQYTEPKPPCEVRPDLPPELSAVILRCLTKDPAMRFQTVIDLACALLPFGPEGAEPPEDRFPALLPSEPPPPDADQAPEDSTTPAAGTATTVRAKPPPGDDDKPTVVSSHTMGAALTLRQEKDAAPKGPGATGTSISFEPQEDDDEPPAYLPRRWGLGWIVAGVLLCAVLIGGIAISRFTARKSADGGTPAVTAGSVRAQMETLSPTATASTVSAPPTAVSAAPPLEPLPARAEATSEPKVDAAATKAAAKGKPTPAASADKQKGQKTEGAPPPGATQSPAPKGPTGLDTEKCFARLPDGSRKEIPCP